MSSVTVANFWHSLAEALEDPASAPGGDVPDTWEEWLRFMFPRLVTAPFADHHREFWEHVWSIRPDERPRPLVMILSRGGAKTTSLQLATVALAVRRVRKYCLYLSSTQDQANKALEDIAAMLESESIMAHYPAFGKRHFGKYGNPRGWRRNRIWTQSGFVADALGMEVAARGLKILGQRPDLIIPDDLDALHDSPHATRKKLNTLTHTILPTGTSKTAVLAGQNLIIPDGIFARLADNRETALFDRKVIGPIPAIRGLKTRPKTMPDTGLIGDEICAGEPTWEGQNLEDCQALIDTENLASFLREQQHEVDEVEGALWTRDMIRRTAEAPDLVRIVVGVDPSGGRAEIGIITMGLGRDGFLYLLRDATQPGRLGSLNWAAKAVWEWEGGGDPRLHADVIAAEPNYGGDMVASTILSAAGARVPVFLINASRGKHIRAEPVATEYGKGRVIHVGTFPELETELTRWVPEAGMDSPNRLDACWAAGTPVLTSAGNRPVESVQAGDMVLTRAGWKSVVRAAMTSRDRPLLTVELSDGRRLTGTGGHPVWCRGRGWTRLDALVYGDRLLEWNRQSASSSTESPTSAAPKARRERTGSTTPRPGAPASGCSIGTSTSTPRGRFRRASWFTTLTEILSTTILTIWRRWTARRTPQSTRSTFRRAGTSTWPRSARWPLSGIDPKRAGRGIESTGRRRGRAESPKCDHASTAETPWRLGFLKRCFVPRPVSKPTTERTGPTRFASPVPSAERSSGSRNSDRSPRPADLFVVRLSAAGRGPVFNLEVADQPEYFANGVLVHNCVIAATELLFPSQRQQSFQSHRPR